ncbi:MAG: hypothetical protein K8R91_01005 [Phycisphaerae bacterium]|nr:hypothetical protein [Phycisphaerae bacterium]
MRKLAHFYPEDMIKFAIEDWNATHAVGGELIHTRDGYAGTLLIFDRSAREVFRKDYEKPREYFDLLGDMSVETMKFLGHTPSRALVQHLHRRRCEHHQSIIDLGKAAFVKEKSKEEFGLYEGILKRDPGFADVRYWWANQKWWRDGDRAQYEYQMALAMNSYLVEAAVWDFTIKHPPDRKYAESYHRWLQGAEMLVGPDFPSLLLIRLESAYRNKKASHDLMVRATRAAAKYPNKHGFVWYLGEVHRQRWSSGDSDLAASIHLVGMRDRFVPSVNEKEASVEGFALAMMELGHNDIACQVLLPIFQKKYAESSRYVVWFAGQLAESLGRMGRYEEATGYYRIAFKGLKEGDPEKNKALVKGAIAAVLAGKGDILKQILRDRHKELVKAKALYLLEAYRDALDGKPVDIKAVEKKSWKTTTWWQNRQESIFLAQMDLLAVKSTQRKNLGLWVSASPNDRSLWILFDAYDRKDPQPESACFYEAIEWLYGNDPWVKKSVADYRRRAKKSSVLSADDLLRQLKDFTPVPWPEADKSRKKLAVKTLDALPAGAVAAAVRKMIEKREFAKAEELALRFHHLGVDNDLWRVIARANHLVHLVRQARQKSSRP